jgi:hypothetical protein
LRDGGGGKGGGEEKSDREGDSRRLAHAGEV